MAIDFTDLKTIVKEEIDQFDHATVLIKIRHM
jgi:6-pyruvoyl-tetrahydropterin synthase